MESLFDTATFTRSWSIWNPYIKKILGESYTERDLINLGDRLSDVFRTTSIGGRSQGELSGGGNAWESLVCWYINLCTIGSRVVAIKKMSLVPKPIRDAITVNYGNFACNTESDITVIVFPDLDEYNNEVTDFSVSNDSDTIIPFELKGKFNVAISDYLCQRDFSNYEIGVIQCKTNWNDNAQIPMLWDMIYSAGGFRGRNITIGRNGFNIQAIKSFTYSFVTVPSNQNASYLSTSVAVKRVTNLSGGNYWGKPSEQHIAKSIKEIFTNNFSSGFRSSLSDDIQSSLIDLNQEGKLSYFKI